MLRRNERNLDNIPAGTLGIIAIDGCRRWERKSIISSLHGAMKMDTNSWMM